DASSLSESCANPSFRAGTHRLANRCEVTRSPLGSQWHWITHTATTNVDISDKCFKDHFMRKQVDYDSSSEPPNVNMVTQDKHESRSNTRTTVMRTKPKRTK